MYDDIRSWRLPEDTSIKDLPYIPEYNEALPQHEQRELYTAVRNHIHELHRALAHMRGTVSGVQRSLESERFLRRQARP